MKKPLLTVCLITYNHANYIRQSIDSILEQEISFPWELIIADDCSSDGTREIIENYKKKYPELIHLILQAKNVGAEDNWIDLLAAARSKYVLYAEGDDYFTDNTKLQKQVTFLEDNKDFSLCFHPVRVVYDDDLRPEEIFPTPEQRLHKATLTAKDLLANNFMQTNAVMYRWKFIDTNVRETLPKGIMPGDWYMHLYHAQFGKIGFINEVMAVYRRHAGGLWWDQLKNPEKIWTKYGYNFLKLLHEIMLLYGDNAEYRKIIDKHIVGSYEAISAIKPQTVSDSVAVKSIRDMPSETWGSMKHLIQQVAEQETQLQETATQLKDTTTRLQEKLDNERRAKALLAEELYNIKSSKLWQLLLKARSIMYLFKRPLSSDKQHSKSNSKKEKK